MLDAFLCLCVVEDLCFSRSGNKEMEGMVCLGYGFALMNFGDDTRAVEMLETTRSLSLSLSRSLLYCPSPSPIPEYSPTHKYKHAIS